MIMDDILIPLCIRLMKNNALMLPFRNFPAYTQSSTIIHYFHTAETGHRFA